MGMCYANCNQLHGLLRLLLHLNTLICKYINKLKTLSAYEMNAFEKFKFYLYHFHLFSAEIVKLAF